jgi:ABC-2 type transport system ATP-binding protein
MTSLFIEDFFMETEPPPISAAPPIIDDPAISAPPLPVVDIRNLMVNYGRQLAVRDLSLTIYAGEVFGFIGPNGAGKTTTIKVLATLLRPTMGLVRVLGTNVVMSPQEVRRNIGYVPDSFGVYEDLTVAEYLLFFAAAYRIERAKRAGTVKDVLALTDLSDKAQSQVDALSRGMKQRLSIARVLLHDPKLLLLDEPASGLDPRARIELRELLKELQRMGKTILVSSHILHELSQFCSRIGIIEAGQLVAEGSLADIYRKLDLKRTVHVQISNLTPQMIEAMLRVPGIISVDELPDRVGIRVREDELAMEDLLAALHRLGARIRMFQPEAMDMETAFMKLTEGKVS